MDPHSSFSQFNPGVFSVLGPSSSSNWNKFPAELGGAKSEGDALSNLLEQKPPQHLGSIDGRISVQRSITCTDGGNISSRTLAAEAESSGGEQVNI